MAYNLIMGIDPGVKQSAWVFLSKAGNKVYYKGGGMCDTSHLGLRDMGIKMNDAHWVAIEMPIFQGRREINPGPILNTMRAAGAYLGMALRSKESDKVLEIPAIKWRAHLGFQQGAVWETKGFKTIDSRVAHALPHLITGWPSSSNVHLRDAAGVAYSALYAEHPTRYIFCHTDLWGNASD